MEKRYTENTCSRELFIFNKEKLMWLYDPNHIAPKNIIEYIYKQVFKITRFFHQRIIHRNMYDKKSICCEYKLRDYDEPKDTIPKIVVYTCVLGQYDRLKDPLYNNPYVDYIAITDSKVEKKSLWKRKSINEIGIPKDLDNIKKARWVKTHPHVLFPQYDISIWIDGNVLLITDVVPLVLDLGNKILGVHLHPYRSKLSTETKAILAYGRNVNKKKLKEQITDYYNSGYKDDIPLFETTILVRRHKTEICKKMMDSWWQEIVDYTTRDQISLPYVVWKQDMLNNIYILGNNLKLNPRFCYYSHK